MQHKVTTIKGEFFKQRRRWGPSTAVNIFELISNARQATSKNKYITMSYIGKLIIH